MLHLGFCAFSSSYYRGALGAMVVYDVTNRSTFENLNKWFKELENHADKGCIFVLVGNKIDLEQRRQVSKEEGAKYATKRRISFMETSAANNTNVDFAFIQLLKEIYWKQSKSKSLMPSPGEKRNSSTEALLVRSPNGLEWNALGRIN